MEMEKETNDIEMTVQDIFEVMGRLLADNTDLTDDEIHIAIDRAMAAQLAEKMAFRQTMLGRLQ
jgi:hypothetical protein